MKKPKFPASKKLNLLSKVLRATQQNYESITQEKDQKHAENEILTKIHQI